MENNNNFNIYEFVKEYEKLCISELELIPTNEDLKTYLKGVDYDL